MLPVRARQSWVYKALIFWSSASIMAVLFASATKVAYCAWSVEVIAAKDVRPGR